MSSNEDVWKNVGEKFSALGQTFKEHYSEDDSDGPEAEEVKAAFEKIADSLERMFSGVGKAVRDESVKQDAKNAASSLIDALSATVEGLGDDIRRVVKKDASAPVEASDTANAEPSDPVAEAAERAEEANQAVDDLRDDLSEE